MRIGPIHLAPGVLPLHFWSVLYASFITIGMLAGINLLQGYVLTEHLHVARDAQGTVTGNLTFWQEIIALLMIPPAGVLADRIGRRPVMVGGMLVIAAGFALFPFATSVEELTVYRSLFAVGAAALAAVMSVVTNDYPAESSRGKMQGLSGFMSALGVVFMALVVAPMPALLRARGLDPVSAGRVMFVSIAFLCVVSALVMRLGLKGGTTGSVGRQRDWGELLGAGWRAGRNPRVLLSYACAFAGRADNALKGMFVALWAITAAPDAGLTTAEALARGGQVVAFMGVVAMIWTPVFGFILDRINRVTGVALAMATASAGFLSMGLITSPLDFTMLPAFALLSIGQVSSVVASITLVGQEAAPEERGSVVAMNGWCGAVGILIAATIGGRLFDTIGPAAPFLMFGLLQFVLAGVAVAIRLRSRQTAAVLPGVP